LKGTVHRDAGQLARYAHALEFMRVTATRNRFLWRV
jgi:hypothetical protein